MSLKDSYYRNKMMYNWIIIGVILLIVIWVIWEWRSGSNRNVTANTLRSLEYQRMFNNNNTNQTELTNASLVHNMNQNQILQSINNKLDRVGKCECESERQYQNNYSN